MGDNRPIGILDSGLGGLSILFQIKKILPKENLIYFADQKNLPYGNKSQKELRVLAQKAVSFFKKQKVKAVVIACNTASVHVLEDLRKKFDIPVIGVVPAIKPASTLSKNSKIVVMATPATVKSDYLQDLILKYAKNKQVFTLPCGGFVEAIENFDKEDLSRLIRGYTSSIENLQADTVVLGCTHYPLVKDLLEKFNPKVLFIDSAVAVAERLESILTELKAISDEKGEDLYYTNGDPIKFSEVAGLLTNADVEASYVSL